MFNIGVLLIEKFYKILQYKEVEKVSQETRWGKQIGE